MTVKKGIITLVGFLLLALPLGIGVAWGVDLNQVANSRHNLGSTSMHVTTDATTEICVFCHTPHFADTVAPLWNRAVPTTGSYAMYSSETIDSVMESQPTGISLDCLSCHDGTISFDQLRNKPGPKGVNVDAPALGWTFYHGTPKEDILSAKMGDISFRLNLTQDLSDDHPISIYYPGFNLVEGHPGDPDFNPPDEDVSIGSRDCFDENTNNRCDSNEVQLFAQKVECASCHNPHLNDAYLEPSVTLWDDSVVTNVSLRPFLRKANAGSNLCLTCHKK